MGSSREVFRMPAKSGLPSWLISCSTIENPIPGIEADTEEVGIRNKTRMIVLMLVRDDFIRAP
jgi:hypothetical protein